MDSKLTRHLKAKGAHQDIINHLGGSTVGCFTMDIFAASVDDRAQIQAAILDKVTAHKDPIAQLACLKTAWREADAWQTRRITRKAEGLSEETLEEPVSPELSKDVINTFKTILDPRRTPSVLLFRRIHREFERRQPPMYPVSRVRTLAFVQHRAPATKTKLTDRVHLELDGDSDGEETNAQPMADSANKLEALCFGWAISGSFSIDWKYEPTVYAAWHEVSKYHYEFCGKDSFYAVASQRFRPTTTSRVWKRTAACRLSTWPVMAHQNRGARHSSTLLELMHGKNVRTSFVAPAAPAAAAQAVEVTTARANNSQTAEEGGPRAAAHHQILRPRPLCCALLPMSPRIHQCQKSGGRQ